MMKTCIVLLLAFVAAGVVALAMKSAGAHDWVPRYDGAKWGAACLASPGSRTTATTCCEFGRSTCRGACNLADVGDNWKNACRANCQAAGDACLQRVQRRPYPGEVHGTKPPASTQ